MATQSTLRLGPTPADSDTDPWQNLGPLFLLVAAFLAIIIFLPPEGRISVPLHDACAALLGRAAFVLPLASAFVGSLLVVHSLRPEVRPPARRLMGIGVLLLAVLVSEHLLAGGRGGTGLVGEWLSSLFLDLLGGVITVLVLLMALISGTLLAFDVRLKLPRSAPRTENEPHAAS